ncbi:DUF732 domain-containing protein [Candidatus Mycobacterium methanotrophicum]|uniref:DUF732 domain-containing protein n=1 Tax=Candidatus Mycobacterium methanotrophicum TaxID=2943498 RepID=A0ABY4QSZ0_9MYCO|nr:DUF732 domain-containing protein [Candidatus Mycobacterium methanotrophicum]UQX13507.1 DUF732 domain-containing protein [Candidatus Mycobacterium methanotrophicum]
MKITALASTIVAGVALVAGTAAAASAHADPGPDIDETGFNEAGFLAALNNAGIIYHSPSHAVAAGQAVCGLMDNGLSGIEVIDHVKKANPAFTLDGAAKFAAVAANEFCPQRMQHG